MPDKLVIEGGEELAAKLTALGEKLYKRLIRKSLRKQLKPVLANAKANVKDDTGQLRKSLKIVSRVDARKGTITAWVGTASKDYQGQEFYGMMVEYGHLLGSRKLGNARRPIPPHPFLKPAFEDNKENIEQSLGQDIREAIDKEASK